MKFYQILLATIFSSTFVITCNAQKSKTLIKGTVHNWPSDTIYLQTMPFHSPYSSELKFQTISKDSTFYFEFENSNKPFVVQLYSNKKNAELNKEQLLFLNLTEDYYYGHCVKFYTYGVTTYLIEPNKTLNIDLTYNVQLATLTLEKAKKYRQQGIKVDDNNTLETTQKTNIRFIEPNLFQNEYYQKSFDLDDVVDNRLEVYQGKTIAESIVGYKKIVQKLLDKLEIDKDKLSPMFYDYMKAEIEFGAKKEFLKFLMFSKKEEMKTFFSNEISKEIIDIIEFDKTKVKSTTLISEEYNKYVELYLNFKINIQNKNFVINSKFNTQKIKTAITFLPSESIYFYLANHLLQTNRNQLIQDIGIKEAVEEIITKTITKYPDGELNDKLIKKYDLY